MVIPDISFGHCLDVCHSICTNEMEKMKHIYHWNTLVLGHSFISCLQIIIIDTKGANSWHTLFSQMNPWTLRLKSISVKLYRTADSEAFVYWRTFFMMSLATDILQVTRWRQAIKRINTNVIAIVPGNSYSYSQIICPILYEMIWTKNVYTVLLPFWWRWRQASKQSYHIMFITRATSLMWCAIQ